MEKHTEYRLKNVSVTLFAFQIRTGFGNAGGDAHLLWETLVRIGEALSIPELTQIRERLICYENGQYRPEPEGRNRGTYRMPLLRPPEEELRFKTISLPGRLTAGGSVSPVRLHDTHAADLSLSCHGPIQTDQLSHFNPKGILLPHRVQSTLGQTLVLYAEPSDGAEPDRELADISIQAFLEDSDQPAPKFRRRGRIFGSHVFEYEKDAPEQGHIWVWLNQNPEAVELLGKTYDDIMDLLLCRNKILFAYHQSHDCFERARGFYEKLENRNRELNELLHEDRNTRLEKLDPLLVEVPSASIEYSRHLRDIADHSTTLRVNAESYRNSVKSLRSLTCSEDDTTFLENFHTLAVRQFDYQIQTDLTYLSRAERLSQQVIDTIRGMTEIDTLRQLKENEEKTSGRQERLEILVAGIVVTLEVATISAAIDPRIWGETAHPALILFHLFLVGAPAGIVVGLIVALIQKLGAKSDS